jgi:hypothetical protein
MSRGCRWLYLFRLSVEALAATPVAPEPTAEPTAEPTTAEAPPPPVPLAATPPDPTVPEPAPSEAAEPAAEPAAKKSKPVIAAAFGKGITVASEDGKYSLQIRGRVQAQANMLTQPEAAPDVAFLIRRMRLTFRGNLFSKDLEFYIQLGFAPRDMESDLLIPLRDAFITWRGLRDLNIAFGQKKIPFNRERVTSSSSLQLVDRSASNTEFTVDRDIGVQLSSDDLGGLGGRLGYQLGVFTGDGRNRVNAGPGLLYVARVQVQPTGAFEDSYVQSDLSRDPKARLSIGGGVAFNHLAQRDRSSIGSFYELGGFNQLHGEADLMFKCAGFSLTSEVLYRRAVDGPVNTGEVDGETVTEVARDGYGVMAQAGYLFGPAPVEIAARYSEVFPLGEQTALAARREVTAGMSWYPMKHDLKLQGDYTWISLPGEDAPSQHQVRVQTQVAF